MLTQNEHYLLTNCRLKFIFNFQRRYLKGILTRFVLLFLNLVVLFVHHFNFKVKVIKRSFAAIRKVTKVKKFRMTKIETPTVGYWKNLKSYFSNCTPTYLGLSVSVLPHQCSPFVHLPLLRHSHNTTITLIAE